MYAVYAESWSGGSPDAMQDGLLAAYSTAAADHEALLANVGEAWRVVLADAPQIVLHQSDRSHPTEAGTWLAACVFYVRLTGREVPASAEKPLSVTSEDADTLRAKAAANAR